MFKTQRQHGLAPSVDVISVSSGISVVEFEQIPQIVPVWVLITWSRFYLLEPFYEPFAVFLLLW